MPLVPAPLMDPAAQTLFIAALGCFAVFHFARLYDFSDPSSSSEGNMGWMVWDGLVADSFRHPFRFDVVEMMAVSGFLMGTLLLVSSPLVVLILSQSPLTWWMFALTSGTVMLALIGAVVLQSSLADVFRPGPGLFCLSAAMCLNFLGFFSIRRETPPNPVARLP